MQKLLLAMAVGLATVFQSGHALAGKDLDAVKARGVLICGVAAGGLAGFMLADSQGKWTGLDVDVCRAVAAAMFGDSEKVKYVPLSGQQRFTALQSGDVDMLSNNSTWTLTRDTALGLDFTGVTYYDGQGFMVAKKLGVKSAKELNGATICVPSGSTTELNIADYFRATKMTFKPVIIEDADQIRAAFFSGRCDVYTGDRARLYATRAANASNPGRLHDPAGDHLQGTAGAARAAWRQSVRRRRALGAIRDDRSRGVWHHLEERRRDAEKRQPLDQAHPGCHAGHGQGIGGQRPVGLHHRQASGELRRSLRAEPGRGQPAQDRPRTEQAVD
jgi:ABC-type amino acid transport substrate-binding protein